MTASGRTLSRIARVTARGHASVYLAPARLRAVVTGQRARRGTHEGVEVLPYSLLWFLKRRRLFLLLQEGRFSPRFRLFLLDLARCFLSLSGSVFPVAIGGIAGMTASAAGLGGAVCPSTAAGGAVIFFVYGCAGSWVGGLLCPSTSAAGAVTVGTVTAMPAGAGGPPAPLRCMVCLACLACLARRVCLARLVCVVCLVCRVCLACLSLHCQGASALVGVAVARPVVGSTGETWLRWRSPSPVASSRRSGGSTGLPRYEVLDQVFFHPLLVAPSLEVPQRGSSCRLVDCCLASLRAGVCSLPWR